MDSLSPGSVRKPFTERHWRNLLTDIHDGQVGVIAGPELVVGPDAAAETTVFYLFGREACQRLTRNLSADEWREDIGPEAYRKTFAE